MENRMIKILAALMVLVLVVFFCYSTWLRISSSEEDWRYASGKVGNDVNVSKQGIQVVVTFYYLGEPHKSNEKLRFEQEEQYLVKFMPSAPWINDVLWSQPLPDGLVSPDSGWASMQQFEAARNQFKNQQ